MTTETIDRSALDRISRYLGTVRVEGRAVPVAEPSAPATDFMEFDRAMCEAGLTRFIRPAMPGDEPFASEWGLVTQVTPGVRTRRGISLQWFSPERN